MHLIIRSRRTSEIQDFVNRVDPTVLKGTAGDSLKAYQAKNGGTGQTFHDLEKSWIRSQGSTTLSDLLFTLGFTVGVIRERIRVFLATYSAAVTGSYVVREDGTSKILLENGSGFIIRE